MTHPVYFYITATKDLLMFMFLQNLFWKKKCSKYKKRVFVESFSEKSTRKCVTKHKVVLQKVSSKCI